MSIVSTSSNYAYVMDDSGVLGQINLTTNSITPIANFKQNFTDIAVSSSGQLYATDMNSLYSLDPGTNSATKILTYSGAISGTVTGIEFASDGTLHATGLQGATEQLSANFTNILSSQFTSPSDGDVLVNGKGIIYESSQGNLLQVNLNGSVTQIYNSAAANLDGLAYDASGDLLGFSNQTMYMVNPTTGQFVALLNWAGSGVGVAVGATSINDTVGTTSSPAVMTFMASAAISAFNAAQVTAPILIRDSAGNIQLSADRLAPLASAHDISYISLTDSGTPNITLSTTQTASDSAVLSHIVGNFTFTDVVIGNNLTISGLANALGNTVLFSGDAVQYTISTTGNGSSFQVQNGASIDTVSNVQALQFGNYRDIVAAQPATNSVTSGNITEIYGAVFGREPDVPGLAFYENFAVQNPATPLLTYAEFFLASPEYTNNSAHNYAQTVAGDQQFIKDSYSNLLGRTPAAAEIAFYENNVIAPMLNGLTTGTSAYQAAQTVAHAQVLVYFSASPEFLNDVQVTAATPPSNSHWLLLI